LKIIVFKLPKPYKNMNEGSSDYLGKSLIAGGMVGAEVVSKCILDSKPILLYKQRLHLHHWMVGAAMSLIGISTKNSEDKNFSILGSCLACLGLGIFLHDAKDFIECLKF
jgi:hypothetical protein